MMDTREQLHIIDVKSQEELEMVDLAHLGLVYASPHFKAIATGGNVSKAMVRIYVFSTYGLLIYCLKFYFTNMRTNAD